MHIIHFQVLILLAKAQNVTKSKHGRVCGIGHSPSHLHLVPIEFLHDCTEILFHDGMFLVRVMLLWNILWTLMCAAEDDGP